ncbi:hypothetical protein [uncultured Mailhella sp.]|nr:hypothetical protein [uncultured Mailhella sp.]
MEKTPEATSGLASITEILAKYQGKCESFAQSWTFFNICYLFNNIFA